MKRFKKSIFVMLFLPGLSFASTELSNASLALSQYGSTQIISGSANIIQAGSVLSVSAVRTVGDVSYITLKAIGTSATTTLRVGRLASGHILLGFGQLVKVVGTASGQLLTSAGHVLAFIPNQMGRALLFNRKI